MNEPFAHADWGEQQAQLNSGLHRLGRRLFFAFERLVSRLYDAPWVEPPRRRGRLRARPKV